MVTPLAKGIEMPKEVSGGTPQPGTEANGCHHQGRGDTW